MGDRIEGASKQATRSIKEAIGKITGDPATQAEGAAEKATGTAQAEADGGKATVRDTFRR